MIGCQISSLTAIVLFEQLDCTDFRILSFLIAKGQQSKIPYAFFASSNPLVEICANSNVRKTVLIVCDCIFWNDYWLKRIFSSIDLIAIDCVMYEFLNCQKQDLTAQQEAYLVQAVNQARGYGTIGTTQL